MAASADCPRPPWRFSRNGRAPLGPPSPGSGRKEDCCSARQMCLPCRSGQLAGRVCRQICKALMPTCEVVGGGPSTVNIPLTYNHEVSQLIVNLQLCLCEAGKPWTLIRGFVQALQRGLQQNFLKLASALCAL